MFMATKGKAGDALLRPGACPTGSDSLGGGCDQAAKGGREGDVFHRGRWSHDRFVRSTHGVDCTGSRSRDVYVKDGIITREAQATDYPPAGPDRPEHEPRGCPRGAALSRCTYSPTRVRFPCVRGALAFPCVRGVLARMRREAKGRPGGPVPVYAPAERFRVAPPLHPEHRTLPMVWCVPPLSPPVDTLTSTGRDGEDAGNLFGAIDAPRIPVEYPAELFTAGDTEPVRPVLRRLAAMRSHMRRISLGRERDGSIAEGAGTTGRDIEDVYRLSALAEYGERHVIPTAHGVDDSDRGVIDETGCSPDFEGGPGMGGMGGVPFGEAPGSPDAASVQTFHALRDRQSGEEPAAGRGRVNLLDREGNGRPAGLFPPRGGDHDTDGGGGPGRPV